MYAQDLVDYKSNDDPTSEEEDWDLHFGTSQYALGTTLKHVMKNSFCTMTMSLTEHHWERNAQDPSGAEKSHSYTTERTGSAKTDWTILFDGQNELSTGAYIKYHHFKYDYFNYEDTIYIYEPGTDSIIGTTDYTSGFDFDRGIYSLSYGAYAQYRHTFGAKFTATTGLRFDGFEYTGNSYISPRLSLTYRLTSVTDISAAYGRHYQPPEGYMLAFNGANTDINYYYTDQAVLGVAYLFTEDIRGTIEAYYKKYYDYPIERSELTENPYDEDIYYVNAIDGYARGVEFFLQKKVKKNLWGTLSYSFSKAKNFDPRVANCSDTVDCLYDRYPKDFDYEHVFTGILGYRVEFMDMDWFKKLRSKWWWAPVSWIPGLPSDESEYSMRFRYLGGRPYTKPTYHPEHRMWTVDPGTPFNELRMPYYSVLDLHCQSRWYHGKWTLFAYFELDNALNRMNVWDYIYKSDGTVETIYQLERFFIGGFIIEF